MPEAASSVRSTTSAAPESAAATPAGGRAPRASRAADLAYSTFYGGALGGSAIAVFFLILDAVQGRPLFTPSLIGTAFFTDADPAAVSGVRVDMVAYFSLVHFVAFFALGGVASLLYLKWAALRGRTLALAGVVFALLTATLLAADWLVIPGAVATLGLVRVLAANAVTAWVMAAFIAGALKARVA
jgi:hypothetical protein